MTGLVMNEMDVEIFNTDLEVLESAKVHEISETSRNVKLATHSLSCF